MNLAVPVILSQAGQVSVGLIDYMMVGHVGTVELAGAAFANSISYFGMLFGIGISIGLTPLVGHAYGNSKPEKVGEWYKNGLVVHTMIAFAVVALMTLIAPFMDNMGQPKEVVKMAVPYYLITVASFFPIVLFFSFKQFFEGIGNTKIAMYVTLASNILNIILNYILIFGKLGCPAMGLNGAGWATLISRVIMPFTIFFVVKRNKKYSLYFELASKAKIKLKKLQRILSMGFPIGLQMVIEMMSFSIAAIMMGWISKESLAAHQVALGMASFTYMLSFGLGSATTIRVSHMVGKNKLGKMRKAINGSLHMEVAFMFLMGICFIVFRYQLPLLFTNDQEVIRIAAKLLIVGALFQIFDGLQLILISSLRGLADVKKPMFLAFFSYIIVSIPIAYGAGFILNFKEVGIWTGLLFGLATAAVLFLFRIKRLLKKTEREA